MSGVVLTATGEGFRLLKVQKVLDNTPASEGGLHAGDVITKVKGRPVAELDIERIRQMLSEPDQQIELSVERGGQTLQIGIKTRKWF
jgi:S1-C subfamily serine protease